MLVLAGPNLDGFIHHSVFYLGYSMLETTCWQEIRQSDELQPETNPTICKFADSDRFTHFARAVANMSLFTPTGAEVHLCLLCFPEASGKAPHPRLG
jgi:hypothetical protein